MNIEEIKNKVTEFFTKENIPVKVVDVTNTDKLLAFTKDRENVLTVIEKFEDVTLMDGETIITVEPALEVGAAAVIMTPDGAVPLPVGDYELQDGRVIVVTEIGVIGEIQEAAAEGDEEVDPNAQQSDGDVNEKVKRLIERVESVKEFTVEDSEKLEATIKENKFLHTELDAMKVSNTELREFVKQVFEDLLSEPSKEPVVKKKNPFTKEERVNIFTVKNKQ